MKRGIIVDIKTRHWIVLTPDGQFRRIRKTHVAGLGEEVAAPDRSYLGARRSVAVAAAIAVALLLIALPGLFRTHSEVAYYLAIDFNPSLELGVDKHEHVLELRSWNEDGAEIIRGMTYENIALQEVLEQIVKRTQAGPYLIGDSQAAIVTSIAADLKPDDQLGARIAGKARQLLESTLDLTVTVLSAPVQLRDEAEVQGVTPGQMAVHLLSRYNGDPIQLQELREQPIRQAAEAHGGLQSIMSRWDDELGAELLRRLLLQELDAAEDEPYTRSEEQQPAKQQVQDDQGSELEEDKRESSKPTTEDLTLPTAGGAGLTLPEQSKPRSHDEEIRHPRESSRGQIDHPRQEETMTLPANSTGEESAASSGVRKQPSENRHHPNEKGRGAEQNRSPEREPERSGRGDASVRPESDRKERGNAHARPESDRKERGNAHARPESDRKERGNAHARPESDRKERGNAHARPESDRKQQGDSHPQRAGGRDPQAPRGQREGGAEPSKSERSQPNGERQRPARPIEEPAA